MVEEAYFAGHPSRWVRSACSMEHDAKRNGAQRSLWCWPDNDQIQPFVLRDKTQNRSHGRVSLSLCGPKSQLEATVGVADRPHRCFRELVLYFTECCIADVHTAHDVWVLKIGLRNLRRYWRQGRRLASAPDVEAHSKVPVARGRSRRDAPVASRVTRSIRSRRF